MAGAEGFEPPLAVLETAGLPLNLCPYPGDQHYFTTSETGSGACGPARHLLDFFVQMVLAAGRAELLELKTRCGRLLVLHIRVILAFALSALKRDNFAWHRAAPIR